MSGEAAHAGGVAAKRGDHFMGGTRGFLTNPADFRDVSRGNPRPLHPQGRRPRPGPAHARDLAAGDRQRRHARRSRRRARSTTTTPSTCPTLENARQAARPQVPQGDAVPQHRPAARARGCGKACRCARCSSSSGAVNNIRRVYYWGFHNNDPKQLFQSSLSYNQVMETPPWELRAVRRLPAQRPADLAAARRAGAHGRAVGARLQVDQVAAAHRADQRLPGQRHLRRRQQRPRIVPEDRGLPRRRRRRRSRPAQPIDDHAARRWSAGRG